MLNLIQEREEVAQRPGRLLLALSGVLAPAGGGGEVEGVAAPKRAQSVSYWNNSKLSDILHSPNSKHARHIFLDSCGAISS